MGFFSFKKFGRTLLLSAAAVAALGGGAMAQENAEKDVYVSPKFLYSPSLGGVFGIIDETVIMLGGGAFHGSEYSLGVGGLSFEDSSFDFRVFVGWGFSYGYEVVLPYDVRLRFGGTVGLYSSNRIEYEENLPVTEGYGIGASRFRLEMRNGFGGPFARVNWHSVELMYRLLVGQYLEYETFTEGENPRKDSGSEVKTGFGMVHQLALGYCFGKKTR